MSVMTDRTVAALCFAVFAFALVIGYVWGRWNGGKALHAEYGEGYTAGWDEGHENALVWADRNAGRFDSAPPGPARPGERSPAGPGALAEPDVETFAAPVDEPFWEYESPGGEKVHLTAGLRIYPELAALAADDGYVAPSSPKRSADDGESGRDRGTPPIGWVDQQLYLNAVTRARIEAREHAEMEDFHADVARIDDQISRWGDWARESLTPRWTRFERMVST